jgi:CTP:molybdopterin cytidylyltransferase MocA
LVVVAPTVFDLEAVAEVPAAGRAALVDVDTPDALKQLKAEIERA